MIKLTWLGHSCFKIEEDGYTVVIDPMKDGSVPGVRNVREKADMVLCSHKHDDHSAAELIDVSEAKENAIFTVSTIEIPHDSVGGEKRGMNLIHILDDGVHMLIHLGDIGCMPSEEMLEDLSGADIMMIPVGGYYTVEPETAAEIIKKTSPKVIIPMHYRDGDTDYDVIASVKDFLSYFDAYKVYDGPVFIYEDNIEPQIAVLTYK